MDPPRRIRQAHAAPASDIAASLSVDPATGLTGNEAAARLVAYGLNELDPVRRRPILWSIVEAATEPFVLMLALAGGLAVLLGELRDGLLILVALVPIVAADVITTFRAERALETLRAAVAPRAMVRRDGSVIEIPASAIVPGDLVLLRVGDVVPADLRVVRSNLLTIDRSILTGESLPELASEAPDPEGAALAGRRSMAFAGTSVVLGRGEGIVVATGRRTEMGAIAADLGPAARGRSPLQREMDRLVRILLIVATALIATVVSLALVRGATLGQALLAGISAAIAAIPEEPPVLLAVVLSLGAYRLLRRGVLVRRLNAQETLGAVDLIISDKTGTLTENRLTLEAVLTYAGPVSEPSRRRGLIDDALRAEEDAWSMQTGLPVGSFTRALAAAGATVPSTSDRASLLDAQPPGDKRPYSTTRARRGEGVEELALGAPEAVLALVDDSVSRRSWHDAIEGTASAGRRLLLLAGRMSDEPWQPRAILSFTDPLRAGIPEALRTATAAGIQTVVVTGDHPLTAALIAKGAGLSAQQIVTGADLDAMDDRTLRTSLASLQVVARATPAQKLRLVQAARAAGRTVAVTGDGVNDAPALHQADVGVAMGSGTAVAREAADLVLGDDSFATLMHGLAEGRRIVANVQKGLVFLTSTHVALLGFVLLATLAGFTQPLLPIHILWMELFIDLAASVAFEREPAEPDHMRRPPRPRGVPLLSGALLVRIAAAGGVSAAASLAILVTYPGAPEHVRWVAFSALVFGQLVRAYANRSLSHPIRRLPPNGFLAAACVVGGAVHLAIPYLPPLAEAFRASPLDVVDLVVVGLVALAPALVAEVARSLRRATWVA